MIDLNKLHQSEDFQCAKCSGTGYKIVEGTDGYEYATPCDCSAERKFLRGLRKSGLPREEYLQKRIEKFKTDLPWQKDMKNLAEQFIADPFARGIGYFGNAGTGKTFICIAICLELLKQGKVHKYFGFRQEITKLASLRFSNTSEYIDQIKMWSEIPILYIDDLWKMSIGGDGKVNKSELQIMYEIINNRYIARKTTIFSSEYIISQMREIDDAIASRVFEMCRPYGFSCRGENQRFNRNL